MYDENAPYFKAKQHDVQVLHELSIAVHTGEIVAVVGASGSGKTLLADAVLGLFEPNATVTGLIWFDGERVDAAGLRALRGHGLSLVPQSVSHLDPMMRVGKQVEGFANDLSKAERKTRRAQLFERYGLGPEVARLYPHELSGGMARRVLLCCALMDSPRVIVADEPTPGLDLDLAVRALDDFRAFANEGNGVLLITHDIELALRVADRVAVFKDGTVVEETATASFAIRSPVSCGMPSPSTISPWAKVLAKAVSMGRKVARARGQRHHVRVSRRKTFVQRVQPAGETWRSCGAAGALGVRQNHAVPRARRV